MKSILLIALAVFIAYPLSASHPKKEKWFDGFEKPRSHGRAKKMATNAAYGLATGIASDVVENVKKSRNKEYSAPSPVQ